MDITFNNVTYKENPKTPLELTHLKNFSCVIKKGEITTFLGDSWSGKSVIGDLINAVAFPYYGNVKIGKFINDGKKIRNINTLRMNIGHVHLDPNEMLFNKYVKQELEFGLNYFKYKLNKKDIRCVEALKLVGLTEDYLNKKISSLSLTEKKKVSLASILIFNPKVIILEEPCIATTQIEKEELRKLIKLLKEKYKKTIILLTKDTDFAYQVTDKTYLLYKGTIVSSGTKDLMTDVNLLSTYNVKAPEIVKFINLARKKNPNINYTNNILDLIKEVYRNAK